MTSEVSYGQFLEVMEEFAFPEMEGTEELHSKTQKVKNSEHSTSIIGAFMEAMERANFSQLESSRSLASLSSQNLLSSGASEAELSQLNTLYQSVQQVLLPQNESNLTLIDMEQCRSQVESLGTSLPTPVVQFVNFYNEFMHNP